MAVETDKSTESEKNPRDLHMSGKVIRFIKMKTGFKWKDFARVAAEFRTENGGFLRTSTDGIKAYLADTRQVKDVYTVITERVVGKELYNKWLTVAYRDRPEWFSEPSAKQR